MRRSPAEYCYSLLPLDLHVLSLPLAFILSQDQTLHCKNCFQNFLFLFRSHLFHRRHYNVAATLPSVSVSFYDLSPSLHTLLLSLKRDCKSTTFFRTDKIFFEVFLYFLLNLLIIKNKFFCDFFQNYGILSHFYIFLNNFYGFLH